MHLALKTSPASALFASLQISDNHNLVLKWSTQHHASIIRKAFFFRSYLWLGLPLTNRIIYPGFEQVAHVTLLHGSNLRTLR